MICTKCGKEVTGKQAGAHQRWCGHIKGHSSKMISCTICGKNIPVSKRRKTCSDACREQVMKQPHVREKLSKGRRTFLKNNPDKHPWKRPNKKMSSPCEKFKFALRIAGIDFHEEFSPVPDRFFSIDIAFPAIRIGIEINGEQHYNRDKSLRKYYQQRHDLIEAEGWTLYELHYSVVFDDNRMKAIIDSIAKTHCLDSVDLSFELTSQKSHKKKQIADDFRRKKAEERALMKKERHDEYHLAIKESNPCKFGWLARASRKLGVSTTQIRRFVNQHIPNNNFYQRKSRISLVSSSG